MAPKAAKANSGKKTVKKASKSDGAKRPPTAYIIFSTERRAEVRAQNPDASFGDIGKLLGKMWADMPDDEKD
eukprot:gene49529-66351_t